MDENTYKRIGIVVWTANRYIYENPGCTCGAIFSNLTQKLGAVNASSLSMKMSRIKFWSRIRGRPIGVNRTQFLYRVTQSGAELANSPQPPGFAEISKKFHERNLVRSHPADWAANPTPGELLTLRKNGTFSYVHAHRVGAPSTCVDESGKSVYNSHQWRSVHQGELLMYIGPDTGQRIDMVVGRPTVFGGVRVISPDGELLAIEAEHLRPIDKRRRPRPKC